ncbi:MAG: T9SS type A sorting domain-containing protein [Candidatus Zixiibacteriota bacterium]
MRTKAGYIRVGLVVSTLGLAVFSFSFLSPWAKTAPDTPKALTPSSSISVTVVVVSDKSKSVLPSAFSLSQNYPNPFNPQTVIKYALPEDCHVELILYNILGQKVKTLVSEYQSAGYQMVHWNGRDDEGNEIPSGLYFYKIETPKYSETKKMILLR